MATMAAAGEEEGSAVDAVGLLTLKEEAAAPEEGLTTPDEEAVVGLTTPPPPPPTPTPTPTPPSPPPSARFFSNFFFIIMRWWALATRLMVGPPAVSPLHPFVPVVVAAVIVDAVIL
jgi:hypothetical protein